MINGGTYMNIANCDRCGRIFQKTTQTTCPSCLQIEEDEFNLVKKYIKEHPHTNITQLVAELHIQEKTIVKFLREGRIMSNHHLSYPCAKCENSITEGIFCEDCKTDQLDTIAQLKSSMLENKNSSLNQSTISYHTKRNFNGWM